ncbi:hypothetical protein ACFOKI_12265 [Sphingomonas qilianensis]|uniref:DUF4398 domain-containing protein n=1 Tax=Sphingomonas qilianensis TaxID=1736690 RepID=A0ABU9XNS9_9SPHN
MMTKSAISPRLCAVSGLILGAALGACAQTGTTTYPSLLPRAIETRSDAEPVAVVAVAEPDPALDALIADKTSALDAGKRAFATAATRADGLARAARGAAVGSDRWLDAQTALAELDSFRAGSSGLVTDLDELLVARAADGKPPYPALQTARDAAQAELEAESARIATLQASMPEA